MGAEGLAVGEAIGGESRENIRRQPLEMCAESGVALVAGWGFGTAGIKACR